jgi:hypothetical protein
MIAILNLYYTDVFLCVPVEPLQARIGVPVSMRSDRYEIVLRAVGRAVSLYNAQWLCPMHYTVICLFINCALMFRATNKIRGWSAFDYWRCWLGGKAGREQDRVQILEINRIKSQDVQEKFSILISQIYPSLIPCFWIVNFHAFHRRLSMGRLNFREIRLIFFFLLSNSFSFQILLYLLLISFQYLSKIYLEPLPIILSQSTVLWVR